MTDTRIVGGSLWMIGMRWTMRLIGLVSTIVLARLLTPEDFGIVAMALIVVGLLDILADAGVDLALLRDREATEEHWNTAWTIQVIQGFFVAIMILIAIIPATHLFGDDRLAAVLAVISLRPLFEGFRNIGIVAFRRDLDFARDFQFNVLQKLAGFVFVVGLALLWRSYWALIVGRIIAGLIGVGISYWMHPHRPRFTLSKFGDIWGFSQWLLLSRIGIFGNANTDAFVVGSMAGTVKMGDYHIAKEVGTVLSRELIAPIRRALFPNFAILIAEQQRFTQHVSLMLGYAATMVLPVQLGLGAVAPDFVAVILGPRWTGITPLVEILVLAGAATALVRTLEFLLPVTNNTRQAAVVSWLEVLTLIPLLIWAMQVGGAAQLATARLVVAVAFVPVMFGFVARACKIPYLNLFASIWRPIIAAVLMALCVRYLQTQLDWPSALRLAGCIMVGIAIYPVILSALWIVSGRPAGAESDALARLTGRDGRRP